MPLSGGPNGPGSGNTNQPAVGLIPNIITANGDGRNNYFVLDGLEAADWRLQVFNRWGSGCLSKPGTTTAGLPKGRHRASTITCCAISPSGQLRRGWLEVLQ
ncbi:T9SS type B sorting domain-containing protein [Hymenobacter rubidus]|uniref:T9SS type B sorting domain-containing protein n=1 Tax=Hymenobacter rubidus TaxID=1441626 RepID=UPI00192030A8|nr:gliding motility-associated C-terminal domain-containing protein [Hymenobacter rubidus]